MGKNKKLGETRVNLSGGDGEDSYIVRKRRSGPLKDTLGNEPSRISSSKKKRKDAIASAHKDSRGKKSEVEFVSGKTSNKSNQSALKKKLAKQKRERGYNRYFNNTPKERPLKGISKKEKFMKRRELSKKLGEAKGSKAQRLKTVAGDIVTKRKRFNPDKDITRELKPGMTGDPRAKRVSGSDAEPVSGKEGNKERQKKLKNKLKLKQAAKKKLGESEDKRNISKARRTTTDYGDSIITKTKKYVPGEISKVKGKKGETKAIRWKGVDAEFSSGKRSHHDVRAALKDKLKRASNIRKHTVKPDPLSKKLGEELSDKEIFLGLHDMAGLKGIKKKKATKKGKEDQQKALKALKKGKLKKDNPRPAFIKDSFELPAELASLDEETLNELFGALAGALGRGASKASNKLGDFSKASANKKERKAKEKENKRQLKDVRKASKNLKKKGKFDDDAAIDAHRVRKALARERLKAKGIDLKGSRNFTMKSKGPFGKKIKVFNPTSNSFDRKNVKNDREAFTKKMRQMAAKRRLTMSTELPDREKLNDGARITTDYGEAITSKKRNGKKGINIEYVSGKKGNKKSQEIAKLFLKNRPKIRPDSLKKLRQAENE